MDKDFDRISVLTWREILYSKKILKEDALKVLARMYDYNKPATFLELSKKYGGHWTFYKNTLHKLGKKLLKELNYIEPLYWFGEILCQKQDGTNWEDVKFTLRKNLVTVLNTHNFKDVQLYSSVVKNNTVDESMENKEIYVIATDDYQYSNDSVKLKSSNRYDCINADNLTYTKILDKLEKQNSPIFIHITRKNPSRWSKGLFNALEKRATIYYSICMLDSNTIENPSLWWSIISGNKTKLTKESPSLKKNIPQCIKTNGIKQFISEDDNLQKNTNFNFKVINTDTDLNYLVSRLKISKKYNFSLLLYGPPGSGKSEFARKLCSELNMPIVVKRCSDILSRWVGDTEKNTASAFKEAQEKNAILVFDEADSLLSSRENADRTFQIQQVNEMLTWMESHPYPFICTTNFLDSLDEASLRRFTFKIKFNFMTQKQVKLAFKHFFGLTVKEKEINNLNNLTAGDFVVVKRKADILAITEFDELKRMLQDETKMKKSKELSSTVGFS